MRKIMALFLVLFIVGCTTLKADKKEEAEKPQIQESEFMGIEQRLYCMDLQLVKIGELLRLGLVMNQRIGLSDKYVDKELEFVEESEDYLKYCVG